MERFYKIVKTLFTAVRVLFLIVGAIMITVSAGVNLRINGSRRVSARVADVVETRTKTRQDYESVLYTPVYEYYDGGEVKTYKSSVSTSMPVEIGSEATLYISENGIIHERTGALATLFMGIVFAVMGGLFIFKTRKKNAVKA